MNSAEIQSLIEEATFDYTMGDSESALAKLKRAALEAPTAFEAWHALAEIYFNLRRFDEAAAVAERAAAHAWAFGDQESKQSTLLILSVCLRHAGDFSGARDAALRAADCSAFSSDSSNTGETEITGIITTAPRAHVASIPIIPGAAGFID